MTKSLRQPGSCLRKIRMNSSGCWRVVLQKKRNPPQKRWLIREAQISADHEGQIGGMVLNIFARTRLRLDVRNKSIRYGHGSRAAAEIWLGEAAPRARRAR